MSNKKKGIYKVKPLTEGRKNLITALPGEYDIETAEDIQDALKDLLGGTIKSMMEAEMDGHPGYESYERGDNETTETAPSPRGRAASTGNLKLMYHKTARVPLSRR